MREIRTSGSEGGARSIPCSYLYRPACLLRGSTPNAPTAEVEPWVVVDA